MKKYILSLMVAAASAISFTACVDDTTEGLTRFTYYPVIELEGDTYMIVDKGSSFQDPGFVATLNGEDISSAVSVKSSVNTAQSGVYSVQYSAVNEDGFSASASRTVVVLDPNDPIEGFYYTSPSSYRLNSAGAQTVYGSSFEILVIGNGDGTYTVDDMLGGYYGQRAGYGARYYCEGLIEVDEDGNVSCLDSYVPGWGDYLDDLVDGTYDAATGTFTWDAQYAGMDFYVTMSK